MRSIRNMATGAAIAAKAIGNADLLEIVSTMIILLSLIVELLKMWKDRQTENIENV